MSANGPTGRNPRSRTNGATKRWRWYAKPFYWGEAETLQEATEELNRHASIPLRDCEPELSPTGVSMNYYCKTENGDWAFVGDVTRVTWDAEAEEGEGGGGKISENNPARTQPYDEVQALYKDLAKYCRPKAKDPFDAPLTVIQDQAEKIGMGDELTALFLIGYVNTPEAVEYAKETLGYRYAIGDLLDALASETPAGAQPYYEVRALYNYLVERYAPEEDPFDAPLYRIHHEAKKLGMGDKLTALFLIGYVNTREAVEYAKETLGYQYAIGDLLDALAPGSPKSRTNGPTAQWIWQYSNSLQGRVKTRKEAVRELERHTDRPLSEYVAREYEDEGEATTYYYRTEEEADAGPDGEYEWSITRLDYLDWD